MQSNRFFLLAGDAAVVAGIIGILCIIDLHFISEKPCLDTKLLGEKKSMWIKVVNS